MEKKKYLKNTVLETSLARKQNIKIGTNSLGKQI